jgi:hypothetical protein
VRSTAFAKNQARRISAMMSAGQMSPADRHVHAGGPVAAKRLQRLAPTGKRQRRMRDGRPGIGDGQKVPRWIAAYGDMALCVDRVPG